VTDAGPRVEGAGGRGRALLALVLLVGPAVAGCLAEPETQLRLRQGDLARVELVAWNGSDVALPGNADGPVVDLCGAQPGTNGTCPGAERAYVLGPAPPAELPAGWGDVAPLPGPLVELLEGREVGPSTVREDVLAFGPYREDLVETHPVEQRLPRVVDDPTAYGRTWPTTELENGSHRIEPGNATGASLAVDRWCNERFCLFESTLVGHDEDHLVVEHQVREGQAADARDLDARLAVIEVANGTFTVDGNPAHAGERFDVFARVVDARGPPSGAERAPGFELEALDGSTVALADLLDRPVVLEFFATWCPSCAENAEHLAQVEERFGDRVHIVSVAVDPWEERRAFEAFAEEHGVTWPIVVDEHGEVAESYGVGSLSTEVVVAPGGAVLHTETGVADHERVVRVLEELLAETEPGSEGGQR